MPSSATPILKLEDQATGENAATWGTKTDNNLELVEQAIKSVYSYSCAASGDITLDDTQFVANDVRRAMIRLTGSRSAAGNIVVPTRQGWWFFENLTTGGYAMTVKTSAGTGISLPASGGVYGLFCDGTNVENMELVNDTLLQAELGAISAGGFYTTSSSSNAISIAGTNLTFTTAESGKAFTPGTPLRIARTSDPANYYMDAIVVDYTSTTLQVTVTDAVGSGTFSAWSISVAGGPSITSSTIVRRAVTTNDTIELTDNGGLIDCTSGSFTLTLPAAATAGNGFNVRVVNSGSGTVVVDGDGSETINGSANKSLAQYQCVHLFCNGTGWVILSPSKIVTSELGTGTADSTTFLRGDLSWAVAGATLRTVSSNDTLVASDNKNIVRVTSSGVTLGTTAAATLGAGWRCRVQCGGDYNDLFYVIINPNSTEEIDDQTQIIAYQGEEFDVYCDGTKFYTSRVNGLVFFGEQATTSATTLAMYTDSVFYDDPEIIGGEFHIDALNHNSGSNRDLYLRVYDGGSAISTSSYAYGYMTAYGTPAGAESSGAAQVLLSNYDNGSPCSGIVRFTNARATDGRTVGSFQTATPDTPTPRIGSWVYKAGEIEGFQFSLSGAGDFNAGVVRWYGIRGRRA
jgi:hypothetical protein